MCRLRSMLFLSLPVRASGCKDGSTGYDLKRPTSLSFFEMVLVSSSAS